MLALGGWCQQRFLGKDFLKILSTSDLAAFSELKTGKGGVDGVSGNSILYVDLYVEEVLSNAA